MLHGGGGESALLELESTEVLGETDDVLEELAVDVLERCTSELGSRTPDEEVTPVELEVVQVTHGPDEPFPADEGCSPELLQLEEPEIR